MATGKNESKKLAKRKQTIAKSKKIKKTLPQSEERNLRLFSSMTHMFEALDIIYFTMELTYDNRGKPIDGIFHEVNSPTERLLRRSREQLIGHCRKELFGNLLDELPEKFDAVLKTGTPSHFEGYGAGLQKYYDIYAWKVAENKVSVILRDISESKKAEEALRTSEQIANDLIKYAPGGIYELDYRIPPKFRRVNDAMCQILGYSREELLAMGPSALLDEDGQKRFRERIMKMLAGEKVDETVEFKVKAKDGRKIDAILNTTFTFKDGKPDGALVVAHDITRLKKAERVLEERAMNLESLVEERTKALRDSERLAAVGATAGMVGHDIRNPLQAITSDVYLIKSDLASLSDSDEKRNVLESLEEIERNAEYINKIVQDLQDYARPLNPKTEESDLSLIIQSLIAKNDLPDNINVCVCVAPDARMISADSYYLNRILYNLVTNSVQAMPDGGELTIRALKDANDLVLSVEDTGVGIPRTVRDKIFSLMFTTKAKGQGFGLPVVKRMTESLGGTVAFESEEGKGTQFIIRLPLNFKKKLSG